MSKTNFFDKAWYMRIPKLKKYQKKHNNLIRYMDFPKWQTLAYIWDIHLMIKLILLVYIVLFVYVVVQ